MGAFVKGDVVVAPFPFSDLSDARRRPALVVATLSGDDVILCQITSQARADQYAIPLDDADFRSGGLRQASLIRPNRLFLPMRGSSFIERGGLPKERWPRLGIFS